MKYMLLLSQENLKLSKQEALSLLNIKKSAIIENMLFLDSDNIKIAERLAYTKKIYQVLFETTKEGLIKAIKNYDWQSIYKENFCIRVHKFDTSSNLKEKDLASCVWKKLKNPKVNLNNPKTSIEFFVTNGKIDKSIFPSSVKFSLRSNFMNKNKIYATKLIKELKHDFESRKAHKKPELHPTALNPKLARALINLSGAEKEIIDPFCGAGGILIEAGLIKLKATGYDLYPIMLKKAKINLDYYKIKNYELINKDALQIKKKYDYIVTDLPYGLNTSIWVREGNQNKKVSLKQTDKKEKRKNLEDFYLKFLKNLKRIIRKKAVVIFPHYVDYKKLIKKANLKLEKEFSQFVHGSLTRRIVVLS